MLPTAIITAVALAADTWVFFGQGAPSEETPHEATTTEPVAEVVEGSAPHEPTLSAAGSVATELPPSVPETPEAAAHETEMAEEVEPRVVVRRRPPATGQTVEQPSQPSTPQPNDAPIITD